MGKSSKSEAERSRRRWRHHPSWGDGNLKIEGWWPGDIRFFHFQDTDKPAQIWTVGVFAMQEGSETEVPYPAGAIVFPIGSPERRPFLWAPDHNLWGMPYVSAARCALEAYVAGVVDQPSGARLDRQVARAMVRAGLPIPLLQGWAP